MRDLAAQVRRLVTAGAKYVVVTGTYDLSKTLGRTIGREALLATPANHRFNEGLLVGIVGPWAPRRCNTWTRPTT